jgi:hypothetical protein
MEHGDIPFFDIINYSVQNGFRHVFRRMPHQLVDYHVLCETLDFLGVDVAQQQKLKDVVKELKTGYDDYDREERRVIKGSKGATRDAAFRLLYLFLVGAFQSDVRDGNIAYNAVLYIVSHRRIFKYRAHKMA